MHIAVFVGIIQANIFVFAYVWPDFSHGASGSPRPTTRVSAPFLPFSFLWVKLSPWRVVAKRQGGFLCLCCMPVCMKKNSFFSF